MAITPISAGPNVYRRESTSTDGWTPDDHIREVMRIMGDEIGRLRKYIASCEFDMQEYGGLGDREIELRRASHLERDDMGDAD